MKIVSKNKKLITGNFDHSIALKKANGSVIDVEELTLNPEEVTDVSKAIFERVFQNDSLEMLFVIDTGIERDEQILFVGKMGKLGQKIVGCVPETDDGTIGLSEKFWRPVDWGFKLKHCKQDLNPLFKMFKNKLKRNEMNDLQGTEELAFIVSRLEEATIENLHRLVWFSDTDMDIVSNSGVLNDDAELELPYWTVFDGIWKQIFAAVTATTLTRVTITENAAASYEDQQDLAGDFAYTLFKAMHKAADRRLRRDKNAKFYITQSIYENWEAYIEDKTTVFTMDEVRDGVSNFKFRGHEIIIVDAWDEYIQEFDNGTILNLPHRAIFTVRENMHVGTMDEESMTEVKSWFNIDLGANFMQLESRIDVKWLEDYMGVVAY